MAFEEPARGDTWINKQEMDLAFATALLSLGLVNERQLNPVLKTWTIYGSQTLADKLVRHKIITEEQSQRCLAEANRRITRLNKAAAPTDLSASAIRVRRAGQLDGSGRVAKLLGLTGDQGDCEDEVRQLDSRYTLVRKLGEGGLGIVWLAHDENLRRYVAIKEIRSRIGAESELAMARFKREAELTGRLEHHGIIPIYQFGTDEATKRYFYVMRFVGKQTMQDTIQEYHERREQGNDEPLLLHRLLTAFVNLCQSVAHAHSKKVIHRDLKPENVALDGFGQVILLDWGLAKINDETGAADASFNSFSDSQTADLTVASEVLGSPLYMAPEQATGRSEEIDERTDVFGLGAILFAILTGHAPHEKTVADTNSRTALRDLLSSIVAEPIPRPSHLVSNLPPPLEAICIKATNPKRYLRYSSASAIAEDVERYLAGDQVTAYQEPTRRRIVRWITQHPRLSQFIGAAIAFIAALVFVGGYSMRQRQLSDASVKFTRAADIAKEISFHLHSQAELAVSEVRFVTELPPIQGIIDARRQAAESPVSPSEATQAASVSTAQAPPTTSTVESESIWVGRLEAIFDGLLRNNESYLTLAAMALTDEVEYLCKSERNIQSGRVRRLPSASLGSMPRLETGPDFEAMRPGDVILQTSDRIPDEALTRFRSPLTIAAVSATFDRSSGSLFGFVGAQLDLKSMLEIRMNAIGGEGFDVYLTDREGIVQLQFRSGESHFENVGRPIEEVVLELEGFGNAKVGEVQSDGSRFYATRLLLGERVSSSTAEVGIVVSVMP